MIAPAALILTDARSESIAVARSVLSSVAEDGTAACAMAAEAIERAITAVALSERLAIEELGRAAFELQELRPNLARLAHLAENAPAT